MPAVFVAKTAWDLPRLKTLARDGLGFDASTTTKTKAEGLLVLSRMFNADEPNERTALVNSGIQQRHITFTFVFVLSDHLVVQYYEQLQKMNLSHVESTTSQSTILLATGSLDLWLSFCETKLPEAKDVKATLVAEGYSALIR